MWLPFGSNLIMSGCSDDNPDDEGREAVEVIQRVFRGELTVGRSRDDSRLQSAPLSTFCCHHFHLLIGSLKTRFFKTPLVSYFRPDILKSMILLVEDEAISRYGFAQVLRTNGHEVKEAADGQEALELLEQYDFDLVITDLAMPKVTGFGLAAQMRVKWPDIPILLLTAYLSPDASTEHSYGKTSNSSQSQSIRTN